jgi:hypothetical protein
MTGHRLQVHHSPVESREQIEHELDECVAALLATISRRGVVQIQCNDLEDAAVRTAAFAQLATQFTKVEDSQFSELHRCITSSISRALARASMSGEDLDVLERAIADITKHEAFLRAKLADYPAP